MARRVRETSKKAFLEELNSGRIPRKQQDVYEYLWDFGPLTGAECDTYMPYPSAHKRLPELRRSGRIVELPEKRICRITGKEVIQWDVK